jgi:hypothetical protein
MDHDQIKSHLRTLGTLHIVLGILGVLGAIIVYGAISLGGILSGDMEAITITQIVGIAISSFILIVSMPGIIGGWGILNHKYWAKIVLLVIGILNLINFPLGTALGVYTIWVLMNREADKVLNDTN